MKTNHHNGSGLDALLHETLAGTPPAHVEARLREHLRTFREQIEARDAASWQSRPAGGLRRHVVLAGGAGAIAVALTIATLLTLGSPGARVYAAAMKALKNVRTLHITGWTLRPHFTQASASSAPRHSSAKLSIEVWEWIGEDRRCRRYVKEGPVTTWDNGERRYVYRAHEDRLYVAEPDLSTIGEEFQAIPNELKAIIERGATWVDLGKRQVRGRSARGTRAENEGQVGEIWIEAETDLVLELSLFDPQDGKLRQIQQLSIAYDSPVPVPITSYAPPKAKKTEYDSAFDPEFEGFNLRRRRLAELYRSTPLPDRMELVPRDGHEKLASYYPADLPGLKSHRVVPVDGPLPLRRFTSGWIAHGSLRIPPEIQQIQTHHDLVYSITCEPKVTWREMGEFVLESLGLEVVEITEERDVLVARYDGRPLKPWREVKAPVPREPTQAFAAGMAWSSGPCSMRRLFSTFSFDQDRELTAQALVIFDETGLPNESVGGQQESIAVSSETPCWHGPKAIGIAKRWFAEEFGVTLTEETRAMTVYVVQRREEAK